MPTEPSEQSNPFQKTFDTAASPVEALCDASAKMVGETLFQIGTQTNVDRSTIAVLDGLLGGGLDYAKTCREPKNRHTNAEDILLGSGFGIGLGLMPLKNPFPTGFSKITYPLIKPLCIASLAMHLAAKADTAISDNKNLFQALGAANKDSTHLKTAMSTAREELGKTSFDTVITTLMCLGAYALTKGFR